ncbi:MAG: hypothetical protein V2A79_00975 [Planctomycetota bacterium]
MLREGSLKALAVVTAVLGVTSGCAAPQRTYQPAQDHNTLNEIEFVHYLSGVPTVSVDEGLHAMLLLADGEDSAGNFEARRALLVDRGIVREAWGLQADDLLDKGTLAYMIVKICKLPGGLNDFLLGSWGLGDRRYALRTATWHEMLPYGMPYHAVAGGELLTAITKAAEYLEREGRLGGMPTAWGGHVGGKDLATKTWPCHPPPPGPKAGLIQRGV